MVKRPTTEDEILAAIAYFESQPQRELSVEEEERYLGIILGALRESEMDWLLDDPPQSTGVGQIQKGGLLT